MKSLNKFLILLIMVFTIALGFPQRVEAAAPANDKIVFGGTYTLKSGETLDGNLAVFGGTASIESGSTVQGNVMLAGGTVTIDGNVNGDVVLFGGSAFINDTAVVHGDVTTFGASLFQANGAQIQGQVLNGSEQPLKVNVPRWNVDLSPFWEMVSLVTRTLAMAVLAMVIVLLAPNATNRAAQAAMDQPVVVGGIGLLTAIISVPVLLLITITIILIPVSLLAIFVLIVAITFGWIAMGLETGKRTLQLLKVNWPLPIAAGIGIIILGIVTGIIGYVPCIGWLAPFLVGILGLGAALVTRFGTRNYPPYAGTPVAPVSPAPISRVTVYPAPETPREPEGPSSTDTLQS